MGEVYSARDTRLGRIVAIKFISNNIHVNARERFAREAQLASSLNHPNIVTVYDVGEQDGHPFIVMEMIAGESLFLRLVSKPFKIRRRSRSLARWPMASPLHTRQMSFTAISNRRTSC
jgi:eukaryotic-like serine/threonine-protein kinase